MEALVAVGLAGNVVQFIQGAGALLALAREIQNTGRPRSLIELERLSQSLVDQTGVLQSRLEASGSTLTTENQNLLDVTLLCRASGTELIKYLKSLSSCSAGHKLERVVKTVKTTLKYQWSHGKVKDFAEKLDRLRGSLILATVLACRTSSEDNHRKILDHLEELQRDHRSSHQSSENVIDTTTEVVPDTTSDVSGTAHKNVQCCVDAIIALRNDILSSTHKHSREIEILQWLDFRQNSWRYDGIDEAYEETYRWIFERSAKDQLWPSFPEYLEEDVSKPYFINGKAGSGKSTLMKYIFGHPRTVPSLQKWAGGMELVQLHCFFWNLGTNLQKSYAGMLRTFLHAVLQKYPELIPAVLPKHYHNWKGLIKESTESEPTYVELKKAFEMMIERCHYLKLAIFVDGIDEFEGDHRDMSIFLRSLASERVKLIVSSRPLNSCLEIFAGCPALRLQDLTREDMLCFVRGNLVDHRLMIRLAQQFPETAPKLANDIIQKAEGVFLWVKLVVRLLVQGLENGDILEELQAKLNALPSDLRDLYKRMFARLDPEYQKQSALLFGLKEQWSCTASEHTMPGAVLWYAMNCPQTAYQQPIGCIPRSTYSYIMCSLSKRIQSRCCGLLELRDTQGRLDGSCDLLTMGPAVSLAQVGQVSVNYLHRTVHEFITREDIWQDICALTINNEHPIRERIIYACLSMVKLAQDLRSNQHLRYIDVATHLCREIADAQPQAVHEYFMTIDDVVSDLHAKAKYTEHWSSKPYPVRCELSGAMMPYKISVDIYTYAANRGLFVPFLSIPPDMAQVHRYALVIYALSSWLEGMDPQERTPAIAHRTRTMEQLLTTVIEPEAKLGSSSLWAETLTVCVILSAQRRLLEVAMLMRIFLNTAQCPWTLWRQTIHHMPHDRVNLLRTMREAMSKHGEGELARLVNEVERLSLMRTSIQPKSESQRNRKRAKKRRAKKLAKRSAE